MRLVRLGLATATTAFGLLCLVAAIWDAFDYATCRDELGNWHGRERVFLAWACNYDLRTALMAAGLALAFGITTYFLLRSRWRRPKPLAEANPTATAT